MPFPPFDRASDVEVLNAYNDGDSIFVARRGTTAKGTQRKARYSFEIVSEPLLHDLNELNLGRGPAEAIKDLIKDQINGISVTASKATIAMRIKARAALERGESWATKRYAGGRIGIMPPGVSDKLFQDSGRLRESIFVSPNLTDATYTVNVAANRLNPDLFGSGFTEMIGRLVALVPALNPKTLRGMPTIERAIQQSVTDMIAKAQDNLDATIARKQAQLRSAQLRLAKTIGGIAGRALGF